MYSTLKGSWQYDAPAFPLRFPRPLLQLHPGRPGRRGSILVSRDLGACTAAVDCSCREAATWSPGATVRETQPPTLWIRPGMKLSWPFWNSSQRHGCRYWASAGACRYSMSFSGGTLLQDLPGHSAVYGGDRLHRIREISSPLNLWNGNLLVNSAHHQAVDRLGSGLIAVQWAPDGTVEALCHQSLPIWGVQWASGAADGSVGVARDCGGTSAVSGILGTLQEINRRKIKKCESPA